MIPNLPAVAEPPPTLRRFRPDRPLILVTDYPADAPGGGAVILRSLLGEEERRRVLWLSPTPPRRSEPGSITLGSGSAGRGGRRSLGRDQTIHVGALAREVRAIARDRNARGVWIVMHGSGVGIAARLVGTMPVHLTVHDDPAYANALRSRRYLPMVPWIAHDFARALRGADSVDVIGRAMADRYRRRFGVEASIVHRSLPGPIEPAPELDRSRGLRVGVLGSTYSYAPLPILGRAVAEAARLLGVPGSILVVGHGHGERLRAEVGDAVAVEVAGHLDEGEAVARLRDCFALYLNYPFGRLDAVLRQTSFPTKLGTYAQAARPLLIHAPGDSSVIPLLEFPGYARHWACLRVGDGAGVLARFWAEAGSGASRHDAAEAVRLRYFDPERNRRTLFEALDRLAESRSGSG